MLSLAEEDARVVAGAMVGSMALGPGDRLSDLDLTFAVADDASVDDVLADWTRTIGDELGGLQLFDLPSGPSIYRVFLLPGCLQFDLSFTPAASFGATGPKFKLLFGRAGERDLVQPPSERELFGYAVHHALRARIYVERGRLWHAEYWVSATRDYALLLACRKRGLPAAHGRGFDDLPTDVLAGLEGSLPRSVDAAELLRALRTVVGVLLREGGDLPELRELVEADTLS